MPVTLIVEDDKSSLAGVSEWVRKAGFEVHSAESVAEARRVIDGQRLDLALVDLQLPDGSGLDVVRLLHAQPDTETVMITAHGTIDSAVEALRSGASDYLTKPVDVERLDKILRQVRRTCALREEVHSLRGELRRLGRFGCLIGASPVMQECYDLIARVAPTESSVLLTGETGVGKELAASMVHRLSRRSEQRFVEVNCGAIAPNLIESELFGHEKGSFTGADRQRKGIFEQADGGTLFLDELTETPPDLQVKLLRVLETGTFTRVGGEEARRADLRLIAATNREPEQAVRDGKLREDLLYRINVFPIHIPPLRDRAEDVQLLAQYFLDELNRATDAPKRLTPAALDRLRLHTWPGNVRELRNVVERSFILAREQRIEPEHIPLVGVPPRAAEGGAAPELAVGMSLDEAERRLILATLDRVGGRRRAAAEILQISLKTLYNRLKQYGV